MFLSVEALIKNGFKSSPFMSSEGKEQLTLTSKCSPTPYNRGDLLIPPIVANGVRLRRCFVHMKMAYCQLE